MNDAWISLQASVPGEKRQAEDEKSQDAVWADHIAQGGDDPWYVAVLSDGHGSATHGRAGAKKAVHVAIVAVRELYEGIQQARADDASSIPDSSFRFLLDKSPNSSQSGAPTKAVDIDREVERHLVGSSGSVRPHKPLPKAGLPRAHNKVPFAYRVVSKWQESIPQQAGTFNPTDEREHLALLREYGATLLVVVITPSFAYYLQLGDGDIVEVPDTGHSALRDDSEDRTAPTGCGARYVFPVDDEDFIPGDETDSLCMKHAWNRARVHLHRFDDHHPPPRLIMACTDGYSNAFVSTEGFLKAACDYVDLLAEAEPSFVKDAKRAAQELEDQLEGWLQHASKAGSGDDATLALLYQPSGSAEDDGMTDDAKPADGAEAAATDEASSPLREDLQPSAEERADPDPA
jgi:serine/threonine protein phosphatase PrpC